MSEQDINAEIILDHYRNPHNYGKIANATGSVTEYNPVCGDTVHIDILEKDGKIEEIMFMGRGCSISQGSASMLTDFVKGKTPEEIMKVGDEEYLHMLGLELGPAREKCALLPLNAMHKALQERIRK